MTDLPTDLGGEITSLGHLLPWSLAWIT